MKLTTNSDYYNAFGHYEALSLDSCTQSQRMELYKMMEDSYFIHVPEPFEDRLKKGSFVFKCDFFISKVPGTKTIKWVPTRSADKRSKFKYQDFDYFSRKLSDLNGTSTVLSAINASSIDASDITKSWKTLTDLDLQILHYNNNLSINKSAPAQNVQPETEEIDLVYGYDTDPIKVEPTSYNESYPF